MIAKAGMVFVDTNILIYAHDLDQKQKQPIAQRILTELMLSGRCVVSPQVLQEFYINATRKIARPMTKRSAREIVSDLTVCCIETTATEVASAFRIEDEAKISFWDALICASAAKAGAQRILSEDMNAGQRIAGVRIEDPFL